jgi:hypothetical protein
MIQLSENVATDDCVLAVAPDDGVLPVAPDDGYYEITTELR